MVGTISHAEQDTHCTDSVSGSHVFTCDQCIYLFSYLLISVQRVDDIRGITYLAR